MKKKYSCKTCYYSKDCPIIKGVKKDPNTCPFYILKNLGVSDKQLQFEKFSKEFDNIIKTAFNLAFINYIDDMTSVLMDVGGIIDELVKAEKQDYKLSIYLLKSKKYPDTELTPILLTDFASSELKKTISEKFEVHYIYFDGKVKDLTKRLDRKEDM